MNDDVVRLAGGGAAWYGRALNSQSNVNAPASALLILIGEPYPWRCAMSLRAVGFVEDWLSRNVQPRASGFACRTQTRNDYAMHLLIAAIGSGIPPEEIVGEFPDLIGVITAILAESPLTLGEYWAGSKRPLVSCHAPSEGGEDGVRK